MMEKNETDVPGEGSEAEAQETTSQAAEGQAPVESATAGFPIVGIGASAGGLAAFEAFFSGMPMAKDPGMCFVLVQHLSPDHKSLLTEIIRRYTRMQVFEVTDGMVVQPNCTYIIPPNRDMAFINGTLHLLEPGAHRGLRLPIDYFFRTLAKDQHERAIGIVLSGTGSDGTLGLRAIKGEGGLAMAQKPATCEYNGMPSSAISTGLVDYVLPAAEMPTQLIRYAGHSFGRVLPPAPAPIAEGEFNKIFILLRAQTGHDFSQYKLKTIQRRVERRMAVQQVEKLDEYVKYLQQNSAEVEALFLDLLIGVTQFFRDPEVFAALEAQVIPRLFEGKAAGEMIRVWTSGCSTGEEAYSLAILLQEHSELLKRSYKLQVFGTDIDSRAIERARAGRYPASIAADVSPERLARFFVREPDGSAYRIHKRIRDLLVFSEHDVIKDPPFSKLDLLSCRNLLIYMGGELQKKLIPLFHYALNPAGVLLLGTSETVGDFTRLFSALDRKAKLYQRREDLHSPSRVVPGPLLLTARTEGKRASVVYTADPAPAEHKLQLRELVERKLLQQFEVVGVLIDEQGEILYLHGRTGHYLEPAPGMANMNILRMAREGLQQALMVALHKAATRKETVRHAGLPVKTNGDFTSVNLTVHPGVEGVEAASGRPLFLVVLEETPTPELASSAAAAVNRDQGPADETRIEAIRKELRAKEEYLHSTIEEMETSNEELKSANEEMQSVNEEMQSTNEELETSKEELQSVNEELATVNAELQSKVADLARANNDMNNLLAGTGVGTLFVNHQLRIQRFTPAVTAVINLIPTDVGRPVGDIVSNLVGYHRLVEDVQEVLDRLGTKEVQAQTRAGAWYLLRIQPYRTLENVIEGAVITCMEITEYKKIQMALQESEGLRRLAVVVHDASDAILVQDLGGRLLAWNPAAERLYGWTEAEALTMNIHDLIPAAESKEALIKVQQLSRAEVLVPYHTQRITKDMKTLEVILTATALVNDAGRMYAIATTERLKQG
jgi:two-component system CheB/CheR fusion protein